MSGSNQFEQFTNMSDIGLRIAATTITKSMQLWNSCSSPRLGSMNVCYEQELEETCFIVPMSRSIGLCG